MSKRNIKLEGLRGASAVIVVIYHIFYTLKIGYISRNKSLNEIEHYLFYFGQFGEQAVYFFLALSGYVLAMKIHNENISSSKKWIAWRFMRLVPIYYISLFFAFVANQISSEKIPFNIQYLTLTYIFDNNIIFKNWNPPLWSLIIELIVSVPLILFLKKFRKKSKVQQLVIILSIYFLSYFAPSWGIRYLMKGCAIFYAGILAFIEIKNIKRSSPILLIIVTTCIILFEISPNIGLKAINFSLLPVFYLFLSNFKFSNKSTQTWMYPIFRYFGKISFSLYIFHWPILLLAKESSLFEKMERGLATLILTIMMIAISGVLEQIIDRPLRLQINRILYK